MFFPFVFMHRSPSLIDSYYYLFTCNFQKISSTWSICKIHPSGPVLACVSYVWHPWTKIMSVPLCVSTTDASVWTRGESVGELWSGPRSQLPPPDSHPLTFSVITTTVCVGAEAERVKPWPVHPAAIRGPGYFPPWSLSPWPSAGPEPSVVSMVGWLVTHSLMGGGLTPPSPSICCPQTLTT